MPTVDTLILNPVAEFGPVLTGRSAGKSVRLRIEDAAAHEDVRIDFSGVAFASPSFVDELVAKLPSSLLSNGRVRLENVPPELEPLVRFVIRRRGEVR